MSFLLTLRFQPPSGPTITGRWNQEEAAESRFGQWPRLYGAHSTAVVEPAEGTSGGRRVVGLPRKIIGVHGWKRRRSHWALSEWSLIEWLRPSQDEGRNARAPVPLREVFEVSTH
ncbi:hypothetical protein ACIQRS_30900 [Streptomyces termitum]|uniref:Uncharacterized protein n=1 Tax=Streptomyces termitum TaxID=67368 RepID=A0A918TD51_9ACTN|nr:hypothetical protein [Streptomyces termitum]GHB10367.1 hypothetical protein GCM10010305_61520 [Streptomyces termitum]